MPTTKPAAPASRSTASTSKPGPIAGLVKVLAIAVGFAGTVLSLMACVGTFTGNGYVRLFTALVVAVVVPLVIADKLLPDDPQRAKGLVSDVIAVLWLGFALVFAVALNQATRASLSREGDRLIESGWIGLGRAAYLLAGVSPSIPEPAVAPSPPPPSSAVASSASASSAAGADAGAPEDAGLPESADAAQLDASAADASPTGAGTAPSQKGDKTPAELFKQLAPSVVTIFVQMKGTGPEQQAGGGGGTGFLLDSDGTIATNHHVIAGTSRIRVKFQNGAVFDEIELLADDASADLALLRVNLASPLDAGPRVEASPVTLGDSDAVVVGEKAVSIGNPLGLEHTLTDGLVSSRRMYEGRAWIQMSVPVSPGNSGGPLFNLRGEVIGVTTAQIGAGFGRAQNLNLAVPVNDLKKLIRSEYPQRRKFGESGSSQW